MWRRDRLQDAQLGRRVCMIFLVYCIALLFCYVFCVVSCPYVIYYPTVMAQYSLFVLKVPLNSKQTNKQTIAISILFVRHWPPHFRVATLGKSITHVPIASEVTSVKLYVARWPSGLNAGLAINRSRVQIPASRLSIATLGKLLTHTCLCHQAV